MIKIFARGLTVRETLAAFSSAKTEGHIDLHEFDSFTKVVLNRPASLNTLSLRMIRLLRN
jgi:enoyl-CoA hydratase/carnithine racemase